MYQYKSTKLDMFISLSFSRLSPSPSPSLGSPLPLPLSLCIRDNYQVGSRRRENRNKRKIFLLRFCIKTIVLIVNSRPVMLYLHVSDPVGLSLVFSSQ